MPKVTQSTKYSERFRAVRARLALTQAELAGQLFVSQNYIAQIESGRKRAPSAQLLNSLEALVAKVDPGHSQSMSPHLKKGHFPAAVHEEQASYSGGVASRIPEQRSPSTRADCEAYSRRLFDAAELSDDPDAFPAIMSRLKKQFPLDEWENHDPEKKG